MTPSRGVQKNVLGLRWKRPAPTELKWQEGDMGHDLQKRKQLCASEEQEQKSQGRAPPPRHCSVEQPWSALESKPQYDFLSACRQNERVLEE